VMFESPTRLVLGLLTGILFGFLLQKGRVAKHGVIVGQLVLRDFTVFRIMLTAIAVGSVGFWALVWIGATPVEVKPAQLGGILVGALLFGSGLAVLGYCPGTTVAAVGEGRRDAVAGLLGMLAGAFVFVRGFPFFDRVQQSASDLGAVTLPDVTRLAPVIWVAGLGLIVAGVYALTRRRRGHGLPNGR
jgi:uncharacterized protein